MVEGPEDSASLIEVVWVSLEDTHDNTQAAWTRHLQHTLGSCHSFVAISFTWGKPPGVILTSWSTMISNQEFNQGIKEQERG